MSASQVNPGRIRPLLLCDFVRQCPSEPSYYGNELRTGYALVPPSSKRVAEHALKKLEDAWTKDLAAHQQNLAAIENNKAVRARVTAVMEEVGIPRSWTTRKPKPRSFRVAETTVYAGYLGDLDAHVPTEDGFSEAEYLRRKKVYDEFAAKAEREDEAAKMAQAQEVERKKAERRANIELATILLRYGLDQDLDWSGVLDDLRRRDQRLDLAIAMLDCRGDWSAGPRVVSSALERFNAVTDEDKGVELSIQALCGEDWCGDGRVFRDCEWNYDRLMATVSDQQLVKDVLLASERAGDGL